MSDISGVEGRRLERERVLSLLYEAEMKSAATTTVIDDLPVTPEDFVIETVNGVGENTASLDALIDKYAKGWDVERMASIDKNILRIAIYELQNSKNLSTAVINNEAVELAKKFSSEDASKFVNGILDAVAREVR